MSDSFDIYGLKYKISVIRLSLSNVSLHPYLDGDILEELGLLNEVVMVREVEGRRLLVRRQDTGHVIIRLHVRDVVISRLTKSRVQEMVGGRDEGGVLILAVLEVYGGGSREARRMGTCQGVGAALVTEAGGRSGDVLVQES